MVRIEDVATYILRQLGGPVSTMKLQKLAYYCQAWSLVWDEQPLFEDEIQAWANGPVVPSLYRLHRGHFTATEDLFQGDPDRLAADQRETIDVVLGAYGHLTGQQLSDLSHSERPWQEARDGYPLGGRCTVPVSLETMQDFYSALQAAEDA